MGERLHGFVRELFPLCRSITGDGLRATLKAIGRRIPLVLREVPTGTPALDWQVPLEWNVRVARIETLDGTVVVDFADCNLHVVSYSMPVDAIVSRDELSSHVNTLPDQPHLVPYRTAYYAQQWGFCLAHRVWETMRDAHYRVRIDSTLEPGSLSYGELHIPGQEKDEVLISVHCCHPSLANDNLSGIAQWRASVERVMALQDALGGLQEKLGENRIEVRHEGNSLQLAGVRVMEHDAVPLMHEITAEIGIQLGCPLHRQRRQHYWI
jgi:aminopeptidase-like protein